MMFVKETQLHLPVTIKKLILLADNNILNYPPKPMQMSEFRI